VLLLLVLALLAMFGLLAISYVTISGHAKRGTEALAKVEQSADPPAELLNQAAAQVVRGTDNAASVLRPHSLLEDMYGNVYWTGTFASSEPASICGGQLFEFTLPTSGTNPEVERSRQIGCVLTVTSGSAAGQSTRIVGRNLSNGKGQGQRFEGVLPSTGDSYLINGPAFAGTGFGYNSSSGKTDAKDASSNPYALLPNPVAFQANGSYTDPAGPGGANEDYDAVDYQNMLLATLDPTTGYVIVPSLHRPELIRYWMAQKSATTWSDLDSDLLRKIMLRPLTVDHANFTGSNTAFDPAWIGTSGTPPWDVDTDGDGIPDSIWVDLGMPVRSAKDGHLYKPLFAILCLDMDGRANVNAHGCLAQVLGGTGGYYGLPNASTSQSPANNRLYADGTTGNSPTGAAQPDSTAFTQAGFRGMGRGPADINLAPLFPQFNSTTNRYYVYQGLLSGTESPNVDGRNGESSLALDSRAPGTSGTQGLLCQNKFFDYPANYTDFSTFTPYATPPDLRGYLSIGLDLRGQPVYTVFDGSAWASQAVNCAYELNLLQKAGRGASSPASPDNPYSPAEFERILRPNDVDAARLPARLLQTTYDSASSTSIALTQRNKLTTESWDVPCPGGQNIGTSVSPYGPIASLVAQKLYANGASDSTVRAKLAVMLAPEVVAGLRMDISRRLGTAPVGTEQFGQWRKAADLWTGYFDHDNSGSPTNTSQESPQQRLARHLYVLMMALANDTVPLPGYWQTTAERAQYIAQWAVNVVDFCDRDSIMTGFAYDPTPFASTAWSPTAVVWGCERPELLLSETLAFHDRRTEDTNRETVDDPTGTRTQPGLTTDTDANKKDPDFDQAYRPQGSLFVEVYNPWGTHDPNSRLEASPGEFYSNNGVDLAKVTATGNSPVWRLAIVKPAEMTSQPDPDQQTIERSVYFVDSASWPTDGGTRYYPKTAPTNAVVLPGQYAMIGPNGLPDSTKTYIGFGTDGTQDNSRYIVLDDSKSGSSGAFSVENNGTSAPSQVYKPRVIAVDGPRRLSVSEPVDGYGSLETAAAGRVSKTVTYVASTGKYQDDAGAAFVFDQPLDAQRTDGEDWNTLLGINVTKTAYRMVHLQRLADPTQTWNATSNPYRTIDSMAVDLTSFNGLTSSSDKRKDRSGTSLADGSVMFHTRQRGERNETVDVTEKTPSNWTHNWGLWKQEPFTKPFDADADEVSSSSDVFKRQLKGTPGYLNEYFGAPRDTTDLYKADATKPFPWLTWFNRPYTSPLDLLLVPAVPASKLLAYNEDNYYQYFRVLNTTDTPKPYAPTLDSTGTFFGADVPYPYLLNFFHVSKAATNGADPPRFYRALEYLRVPSPFVGTELQGKPDSFYNDGNPYQAFHPPFNAIPRYREPGKINLNTVFSPEVFRALLNRPDLGLGVDVEDGTKTIWDTFVWSRRGYGAVTDGQFSTSSTYPTRYARPFRAFTGSSLVPLSSIGTAVGNEINSTLLRAHPKYASDPDNAQRALFEVASTNNFNDTNRNAFFRYQAISRLNNLVTTRSNVYAVWITVGYFEAQAGTVDAAHPDGYRLGRELGSDTGDIQRHRAFYLIDRSIPVGFSRGRDLNVGNTILLNRFIE